MKPHSRYSAFLRRPLFFGIQNSHFFFSQGLLKVELLVIIKPKHKKYEKLYISDSSCVVRVADIIIRQNGELIKFERELNKGLVKKGEKKSW